MFAWEFRLRYLLKLLAVQSCTGRWLSPGLEFVSKRRVRTLAMRLVMLFHVASHYWKLLFDLKTSVWFTLAVGPRLESVGFEMFQAGFQVSSVLRVVWSRRRNGVG